MIKWQAGANFEDDFEFTQDYKPTTNASCPICLTKDDKYLLVGSNKLVSVFETTTRELMTEFELSDTVAGIGLIKNDRKAIIAEDNGNLTIINLETLQKKTIVQDIFNG